MTPFATRQALLVVSAYAPEQGPTPRRAALLAASLVRYDYGVTVLAPRAQVVYTTSAASACLDGITVRRLGSQPPPPDALGARQRAEIDVALRVAGEGLRTYRAGGLIVASLPSVLLGPAAWLAAAVRRGALWWDVRDLTWEYAREMKKLGRVRSGLLRWAILRLAKRCSVITTTSPGQQAYFRDIGVPSRRVVHLPNPFDDELDLALTSTRPPGPTGLMCVLYAGKLGIPQGVQVLLHAANLLREQQVRIIIAGDGSEGPRVRELAKSLALTNVEFAGYVTKERLAGLLRRADLCYAQLRDVSSLGTAVPTKLLDYMLAGRAMVLGGRGDAANLVRESKSGLVVPPDDPRALASAIAGLLDDRPLRIRLGRQGRSWVQTHRSPLAFSEIIRRDVLPLLPPEFSEPGSSRPGRASR